MRPGDVLAGMGAVSRAGFLVFLSGALWGSSARAAELVSEDAISPFGLRGPPCASLRGPSAARVEGRSFVTWTEPAAEVGQARHELAIFADTGERSNAVSLGVGAPIYPVVVARGDRVYVARVADGRLELVELDTEGRVLARHGIYAPAGSERGPVLDLAAGPSGFVVTSIEGAKVFVRRVDLSGSPRGESQSLDSGVRARVERNGEGFVLFDQTRQGTRVWTSDGYAPFRLRSTLEGAYWLEPVWTGSELRVFYEVRTPSERDELLSTALDAEGHAVGTPRRWGSVEGRLASLAPTGDGEGIAAVSIVDGRSHLYWAAAAGAGLELIEETSWNEEIVAAGTHGTAMLITSPGLGQQTTLRVTFVQPTRDGLSTWLGATPRCQAGLQVEPARDDRRPSAAWRAGRESILWRETPPMHPGAGLLSERGAREYAPYLISSGIRLFATDEAGRAQVQTANGVSEVDAGPARALVAKRAHGEILLTWAVEREGAWERRALRKSLDDVDLGAVRELASGGAPERAAVSGTPSGWLLAWLEAAEDEGTLIRRTWLGRDGQTKDLGAVPEISKARFVAAAASRERHLWVWSEPDAIFARPVGPRGEVIGSAVELAGVGAEEVSVWGDELGFVVVWAHDGRVIGRTLDPAGEVLRAWSVSSSGYEARALAWDVQDELLLVGTERRPPERPVLGTVHVLRIRLDRAPEPDDGTLALATASCSANPPASSLFWLGLVSLGCLGRRRR